MKKLLPGLLVTIVLLASVASMAAAIVRSYTWTSDYLTSNGTVTAMWGAVTGQACPDIDTAMDLTPGKCASVMSPCLPGTVMSMTCGADGRTYYSMDVKVPGQWTAD